MKHLIKKIVKIIAFVLMLPLIFIFKIAPPSLSQNLFRSISQLLSLIPGLVGSYLRIAFYRFCMKKCTAGVIHFGTLFSHQDTEIEDGVYIGPQCNIGLSTIGKDTLVASGVHIMSGKGQHNFDDIDTAIQQQGGHFEKISIGEDCWLGNGALIMANVGNKTIVAAGAVVVKDVPPFVIVAGNPAKVLRKRN